MTEIKACREIETIVDGKSKIILDVVGKMKERVNEKEGDVIKEGQENKPGK